MLCVLFRMCGSSLQKCFGYRTKKVLLRNYNFTPAKLSSHGAWVEYNYVVEFQLSLRYLKMKKTKGPF